MSLNITFNYYSVEVMVMYRMVDLLRYST